MMPGFTDKYDNGEKSLSQSGLPGSFVLRSPQWAHASSAPSRMFKTFVTENGTLVPMIIRFPGLPSGNRNAVIADIRDLLPTILDAADVAESFMVAGREVAIIEGRSLMPW